MDNFRFRIGDGFVGRIVSDEVVFAARKVDDDQIFILKGPAGIRFWNAVAEGLDLAAIVTRFRDGPGADPEAVAPALLSVAERLCDTGILSMEKAGAFELPKPPDVAARGGGEPFSPPEFLSLKVRDLLPRDLVIQGASVAGCGKNFELMAGTSCAKSPCIDK